jgi:HK97 family phage major capsid protein
VTGTATTTSKGATGDKTMTAQKLSASVYLSGELDDDSIVNIRKYVEDMLVEQSRTTLDNIVVNGDTETGAT